MSTASDPALVPGEWVTLCREGTGEWDVTVKRGMDNEYEIVYGFPDVPRGMCVDNDGVIWVCDTFGNKILRFNSDLKRLDIITHPDLYHPKAIRVDENNVVLLTSVVRGKGEEAYSEIDASEAGWDLEPVSNDPVVADDGETYSGEPAPFGKDGLRYLCATDRTDISLVLVDAEGRYVKSVPSRFYDRQGRYYRFTGKAKNEGGFPVMVYDESGKTLGQIDVPSSPYVKLDGWVYFRDLEDPQGPSLKRYAADGSVEDTIAWDTHEEFEALQVSPNGKHILGLRVHFRDGGKHKIAVRTYSLQREP